MKKREKGITLVALVVTIVVLLILAGVSINLVLGDNGIIKKAQEAKSKTEEDQRNIQIDLESLGEEIDKALGKMPSNEETTPYLPDSTFKIAEGTINTGLVIEDGDGNQYVWVVVPKTLYDNTNYNSNGAKKPSSSTDYEHIEYCLQQYTSVYRDGRSYSDTWAADTDNEGWLTSDEYTELKQKMLKSVYENGGFYVGRYEAGIDPEKEQARYYVLENATPLHEATQKTIIKANAYPYTWVRRTQAQQLAKSLSHGKGYTSSLMFGVQWDLVLAFMAKDTTKIKSTAVLTLDSTQMGNYNNNLWTITNQKAQYSNNGTFTICSNPFKKESSSVILLTTGASSSFSVQNIYDIAGNVWEWTLEKSSNDSSSCIGRGGNYGSFGYTFPAAKRIVSYPAYNDGYLGFRVSIW